MIGQAELSTDKFWLKQVHHLITLTAQLDLSRRLSQLVQLKVFLSLTLKKERKSVYKDSLNGTVESKTKQVKTESFLSLQGNEN